MNTEVKLLLSMVIDKNGTTVAHVAAEHGHLPKWFNQQEIADSKRWTVSHISQNIIICPKGLPIEN